MELQLPVALEVALYVASISTVVFLVTLVVGLLHLKKQIDRVARSVEELKVTVEPLVHETRIAVQTIQRLAARLHERWLAVESALDTVRSWGLGVSRAVEYSADMVMSPVHAAGRRARSLMKGIQAFFQVLLSRTQ